MRLFGGPFRFRMPSAGRAKADNAGGEGGRGGVVSLIRRHPMPLWMGFAFIGYMEWRRIRRRQMEKAGEQANLPAENSFRDGTIAVYRMLPLRKISHYWGRVNETELPLWMRRPILGGYSKMFKCQMNEAVVEDVAEYKSLGELFRRRLKDGARPVDHDPAKIVSPCDGRVLHFGTVEEDGMLEQIKGVRYSLRTFLGANASSELPACRKGNRLYHAVIYLAPGDYHGFHSPVDWMVEKRRHFHGELLSVSPSVVSQIAGLFHLNERVIYTGTWEHGFFSLGAVGATNVGCIRIDCDPELCTNSQKKHREKPGKCHQKSIGGLKSEKGSFFGQFNLGSTIVLVFEAPEGSSMPLMVSGQQIKYGEAIFDLKER